MVAISLWDYVKDVFIIRYVSLASKDKESHNHRRTRLKLFTNPRPNSITWQKCHEVIDGVLRASNFIQEINIPLACLILNDVFYCPWYFKTPFFEHVSHIKFWYEPRPFFSHLFHVFFQHAHGKLRSVTTLFGTSITCLKSPLFPLQVSCMIFQNINIAH